MSKIRIICLTKGSDVSSNLDLVDNMFIKKMGRLQGKIMHVDFIAASLCSFSLESANKELVNTLNELKEEKVFTSFITVGEINKYIRTLDEEETFKCCICLNECRGLGNNPDPISENEDDRCCDNCNMTKVIPARLKAVLGIL